MKVNNVLIITTGGTIGAVAAREEELSLPIRTMPPPGVDLVREALNSHFEQPVCCISLPARDSHFIDDAYRTELLMRASAAPENKIIVTHGTDTLLQTADYLFHRSPEGKTILLTGAMVPLANGPQSDGFRNLGFCLRYLAANPAPGLGIVLHDFDAAGAWLPRLYPFAPGKYEKLYADDARYSRLGEKD